MQLSSNARKGLAAGLAFSTLMMSVSLFALPAAFAAPHAEGCLVNASGTVYMITGGQRRGFPSADVFFSHGNGFGGVQTANAEDLALPVGPVMVYADGTLVKGPNDPLVYLVTNGQKRGFVSGSVFTGLGFKFSNIQSAPANTFADLPTGANIESATERHGAGVWVIDSTGTVWRMTATGRMGLPSMEVFNSYGKSWATVVPANAADLAAPNEGVVSAKPSCSSTSTPTGSVNVSVSGPSASTLVQGQATANLANFVFSGSGTVTSLNLKRIGVSADTTLSNVYLFNGSTRLTDAASVSSGNINFTNSSGLFSVNGTTTISVKSDIAGSTSGQTVGVQLSSVTLSSGSVGGLPVSGNIHTVASATLAGASFGSVTPSTSSIDPANDVKVWEATMTVTERDVNFSRMALRQINSINSSDVKNFRLYVDGVMVGSAVASLDSNGYVTFSGFNKTLTTGSRVVKVLADVIGGSSRKVQMSLRNKADIDLTDSQYGVNVALSSSVPASSGEITINNGSLTVEKATDAPSGNVTKDASDVVIGKWTLTAYGEPIKLETLTAGYAHVTSGDVAETSTLRNARLMFNGVQYGSTSTMAKAGTSFTVNYTVNPGAPVSVEVRADMFDNDGTNAVSSGDKITAKLVTGSSNAQRQVSLGTFNAPGSDVDANQVTVAVGSVSLAQQTNYANQTVVVPQTAYKLAALNLTGNSTEDVNVNDISVDFTSVTNATFAAADLSNVYLKYGSSTSTVKSTVSATGNSWSVSFVLAKNAVVPVEIYATIGSSITSGDSIKSTVTVTGTTAQSATSVNTGAVDGQTIAAGAGSITATKDASSPAAQIVHDNQTVDSASFKLVTENDSYTLTEVVVTLANATAVQNVMLMDGSTTLQTKPGATTVTFSGLSVPVSANNSNSPKVLKVSLQLGTVGTGAGTTGSSLLTTLTSGKAIAASSGVEAAISESNPAANAMYVYAATPTVSRTALASTAMTTGVGVTLGRFSVTSNGGTIGWKNFNFTVSKTGRTTTGPVITDATLWDADTGLEIAGTDTITTLGAADTAGSIKFVATDEQEVSGTKNYILKATITSTLTSGDNINTSIASDVAAYAAPTTYAAANTAGGSIIWTDRSAQSHGTGTSDWNNNYLVKFIPLDSWTLTVN
jgi:hypothetical protein